MAQLCQHQDELKQLKVTVLLLSFGAPEVARVWLEGKCPSFQLLLDTERTSYRAYGLERSWLRSWNLKTLWYYLRALLGGRKWHGIQGDSTQLGGDFIVSPGGRVLFAYRSHDPTDRPKVSELIAFLREIKGYL